MWSHGRNDCPNPNTQIDVACRNGAITGEYVFQGVPYVDEDVLVNNQSCEFGICSSRASQYIDYQGRIEMPVDTAIPDWSAHVNPIGKSCSSLSMVDDRGMSPPGHSVLFAIISMANEKLPDIHTWRHEQSDFGDT